MDTSYSEQMMIEIKQILNNAIEEENVEKQDEENPEEIKEFKA